MKDQQKTEDNPFWLRDKLMAMADEFNRKRKIPVKNIDEKKAFENWNYKTSIQEALIKLDLLKKDNPNT